MKRRANRRVVLTDADQVIERALKGALEEQRLLGLIERHGWMFGPEDGIGPDAAWGPWEVET